MALGNPAHSRRGEQPCFAKKYPTGLSKILIYHSPTPPGTLILRCPAVILHPSISLLCGMEITLSTSRALYCDIGQHCVPYSAPCIRWCSEGIWLEQAARKLSLAARHPLKKRIEKSMRARSSCEH
eukprot:scaffold147859_cov23-Tisochrysis_lutea.AAC.1